MEAGRHWLDAERLRVYPRIFVGVYAVAVLAYALSVHDGLDFRGQVLGSDFVTFYAAARLALSGHGVDAWNLDALLAMQHQVFPAYAGKGFAWFYPPTFLLVVTPLALLPHLAALAVFVGTTATGWALALRRAIGRPGAGWLVAAFPGLWVCAAQGQNAAARMARSMALRTRTMLDKSTRNLAGLLAEEAGRTAAACRRAEDGCPQASAGAQKLSRELAELASGAEQAWRAFL